MSDIAITFAVLAVIVVLFVSGRLPVEVTAIGATLVLWATGILSLEQALAGFGDSTVIFIAALFVVSEGLDSTGVTAWAGQQLMERAGQSRARLLILMMLLVAGLTAIISVNGAVAALLPVVVVLATRTHRPASLLLIPLVFGAHAGSMLALTGTPVNVLVSDAALEYGGQAFGFFEFALVGLPLLAGTIAVVVLLGDRLLPVRTPRVISPDLSRHARTLIAQYGAGPGTTAETLAFDRETGLAEVVIPPRSPFVGERVFPGMATEAGDLVVQAVQRKGEPVGERGVELAVGDTLLLQGPWEALDARADDPGLLVVDQPALVRRQAIPLGAGARRALLVAGAMVVLLATGIVPSAVAGLLAAGALIVTRVMPIEQAYRAINWTTVVLVGAMLPLSTAMTETGAAKLVADGLVEVVRAGGPYALLAGLFAVTMFFGQLISNMATALIMIPIAIASATELGIAIRPVLMSLTVAAAASLLTPVATPVNLMIMGPAGYRFADYWKLGLAVMVVFFVVAVFLVPVFWPFT
jgi:di/tricarboxylate transporter